MANGLAIKSFSNFVKEVNARAQECDPTELADWAVRHLSREVGFECAWYGWAQIDRSGVRIHANTTLDLPETYYPFWTSMAEQDLLAARLLDDPAVVAIYDRRDGEQNDGMTTLADRYGLEKMATVMNHREGRLASFYLSSYRHGSRARAFGPDEQEYLQCAVEQLGIAMRLGRIGGRPAPGDASISILVNESGIGILGLRHLREHLGDFWPEWKGDLLPEKLRGLLAVPGHHYFPDRGVVVSCEAARDCKAMGLRRLTIRRMSPIDLLTAREREISGLLAKGLSHKDVARQLGIAPSTVRNQIRSVYLKTGISSRAELATLVHAPAEAGAASLHG